jgi:hypothetical protein
MDTGGTGVITQKITEEEPRPDHPGDESVVDGQGQRQPLFHQR